MIGETIGNFRVVSRLGRGGMGEVYLAEHQSIGTRVAIKLLPPQISEDASQVQRLFNEARAVDRIHHAGIVRIFDVGTHTTGQAYLIMEFLDGETLGRRIRRGRLGFAQVADFGRQIAGVLEATHAAGITHRDLKPDNIYLVADRELAHRERVKVLDFGIAKLTGTLAGASPQTMGTLGTPAYMAPEQWGDSSKVDWRADVYSLGCVVFEMLCGRPPFLASNFAEACAKHLTEPPPLARALEPATPEPLEALLHRMLAKDPAQRPASMHEAAGAFEAIGKIVGEPPPRPRLTPAPAPAPAPTDPGGAATMRTQATGSEVAGTAPTVVHPPVPLAPARHAGPRRIRAGRLAIGVGLTTVMGFITLSALRGGGDGAGPGADPGAGPATVSIVVPDAAGSIVTIEQQDPIDEQRVREAIAQAQPRIDGCFGLVPAPPLEVAVVLRVETDGRVVIESPALAGLERDPRWEVVVCLHALVTKIAVPTPNHTFTFKHSFRSAPAKVRKPPSPRKTDRERTDGSAATDGLADIPFKVAAQPLLDSTKPQLQTCPHRGLASGMVRVGTDGRVIHVQVTAPIETIESSDCVRRVMSALVFDKPAVATTVNFRYLLE